MASIRTIAEATGYSVATVSEALRKTGRVSPAAQEKILAEAARQGYVQNALVGEVMSVVRRSQVANYAGNIALISTNDYMSWTRTSYWHKSVIDGARKRAEALGFKIEPIGIEPYIGKMHRLTEVIHYRGIQAVFIPSYPLKWKLHGFGWDKFSVLQAEESVDGIDLNLVAPDHYQSLLSLLQQLQTAGYERPGLIVNEGVERYIGHRWKGGYHAHYSALEQEPLPVLLAGKLTESDFQAWFETHKPDLIISHATQVRRWLEAMGLRMPEDVGLFLLNHGGYEDDTSGFDLQPELMGSLCISQLISQVLMEDRGIPEVQRRTLVRARIHPGTTVRWPEAAKK